MSDLESVKSKVAALGLGLEVNEWWTDWESWGREDLDIHRQRLDETRWAYVVNDNFGDAEVFVDEEDVDEIVAGYCGDEDPAEAIASLNIDPMPWIQSREADSPSWYQIWAGRNYYGSGFTKDSWVRNDEDEIIQFATEADADAWIASYWNENTQGDCFLLSSNQHAPDDFTIIGC